MPKSILLSFIFFLNSLIVLPSIVLIIDKSFDVTICCLDINEEESKKGETEIENKLELKFFEQTQDLKFSSSIAISNKYFSVNNKYNLLHYKDHSPPPEHII